MPVHTDAYTPDCAPTPHPLMEHARWPCHSIDVLLAIDKLEAGSGKVRAQGSGCADILVGDTRTQTHTQEMWAHSILFTAWPQSLAFTFDLYLGNILMDPQCFADLLDSQNTPTKPWTPTYSHINPHTCIPMGIKPNEIQKYITVLCF